MRGGPSRSGAVRAHRCLTLRRFRGRGSEGVAIAELMSDLKLTHGGFYRHFKGKEHLFTEAFAAAAAETRSKLRAVAEQAPPGRELEAIVNTYLSVEHCGNPGHGCPLAALAAEISRHPKTTRATFDHALRQSAAELAPFVAGGTSAEREHNAMVLFAGMAGTLTVARAAANEELREQTLETARKFYLNLARRSP